MTGKIVNILKEGNIVVPKLLLANYKKLKITADELILLLYLIDNNEFDPKHLSEMVDMKSVDVIKMINGLTKKGIVTITTISNNDVHEEYVNLDNLYNKLVLLLIDEKEEKQSSNIYDKFEKEFARTLSPMEYEIIGAWIDNGFLEEMIDLALKEAVYNGVTNLRYIDKILYEWKKKGIKSKTDIEKERANFKKKNPKGDVFDYDWLNE